MSATSRRTRTMPAPLPPLALRGLLDATPAAVGCFDQAMRTVYANTAFTMATGLQIGSVVEDDQRDLAPALKEMHRSSAPRRVRLGRARMPVSGTLFRLDEAYIGMVLDAGAHEALARLADEQSALRRVAMLVAAGPEPEDIFTAVAEEAGRLMGALSAATIRYDGDQAFTVGRWSEGETRGFQGGTAV